MKVVDATDAMVNLERIVAAVKGKDLQESKFAKTLATLKALYRKEGIPLAIVGGLAAIHHGYERFTNDIDVVPPERESGRSGTTRKGGTNCNTKASQLVSFPRVASLEKTHLPPIPGPEALGVREGAAYAGIAGWMEAKLGSYRVQARADVVQVIKVTTAAALRRIRKHLGKARDLSSAI